MNHFSFACKLEISDDGQMIILSNNKMTTNPMYEYEKTPDDINREK